MYEALILLVLVGGGLALAYFNGGKSAKNEVKLEQATEALDDITKANDIVDHYNRDPEYRKRVQNRFKRK